MTLSSGKRASIVDASSGIGEATALSFARACVRVALVSRSEDKLEKVARSDPEQGIEAKSSPSDLTRVARMREPVETIASQLRPIDLLVNHAGMGYTSSLMKISLVDWQQVLDLNLTRIFECVRTILSSMEKCCRETIANVASIATVQVFPIWGVYSVSQLGLMALSKTLALKDSESGIRVSSICRGAANTSTWNAQTVRADFTRATIRHSHTVTQMILQTVQLPSQADIGVRASMSNAGVL